MNLVPGEASVTGPTAAVHSAAVKVLIVGSGGREHALAWKLSASSELDELHAAPGNPGIAALGQCHPVRAEDGEGLLSLCRELGIDLVVVGPEAPLVGGLVDTLRRGYSAGALAEMTWICPMASTLGLYPAWSSRVWFMFIPSSRY